MADEFQLGSGNWWDAPSTAAYETPSTGISTTLNAIASYGWTPEMAAAAAAAADGKSRSSVDSSAGTAMLRHGQSSGAAVQIMGLGLSDWNPNQAESSFRPMIHDGYSSTSTVDFQQAESRRPQPSYQELWSQQQNQGFARDQTQFIPNDVTMTSQNLAAAAYGLLTSQNQHDGHQRHHQPYQNRPMNYPYPSNEYNFTPPFLRSPSQKQPPPAAALHFSNNTPFWNASASAGSAMAEAPRPAFYPDVQKQILATPSLDEKAKSLPEIRDVVSTMKKTTAESSNKRSRNDSASVLPAFKVRKEKMGDRITALQQLVSPFGKTDTASVLSEAIEYIKYLHEQVSVLSAPYMKHAAPIQHNQAMDRSTDEVGDHQDLRSRGLCLVPISSTFPVTHESTVDFWTPAFGGTFR